jgi:sugar transferase (PEP-CTERM system associated)
MIKIFNHYFHRRTLLQVLFDALLMFSAVIAAVYWQSRDVQVVTAAALSGALLVAAMLAINGALGFYQRVHNRSIGQSRSRAVLAVFMTMPLALFLLNLVPVSNDHQEMIGWSILGGLCLVMFHRVTVAHTMPKSKMRQRVLVFGTGSRARQVGITLKQSDSSVDVVGYYAGPNETTAEVSAWGVLEPDKSLTDIVIEEQVDEIVVALSERRGGAMLLRELLDCKLQGVRVLDMATHFEKTLGQIRLDSVSAGWLIFGDGFDQSMFRTVVKRIFDLLGAFVLLVLAAPVMLVTAVLIYLESGGPVLYYQERVGLGGRLFNVIKFRSMRTDAEKDGKPRWAAMQDDRVTRVGRIIRKLRIDELPQLLSVLAGDMSLVGPRPERPYFVDKLTQQIPYYAVRQSVKPGVTGWAQVRYHYGSSVEDAVEKLQYDLYYVKNHTLFLDLVILFETVGVVVMAKGA